MGADTWGLIAKICFVFSGCSFVLGVYLFRAYDVLQLVRFFSGKSRRQETEQLRFQNIEQAKKTFRPEVFELETGEAPFVSGQTQRKKKKGFEKDKAEPLKQESGKATALLESLLPKTETGFTKPEEATAQEQTSLLGQSGKEQKEFTVIKDILVTDKTV